MDRARVGSRPAERHDFIGRAPYANDVALSGLCVDWFFNPLSVSAQNCIRRGETPAWDIGKNTRKLV
jgi:hypothetical protein